eukprot:12303388-Alexandrium_andersonii.AAC.1
MGSGRRAPAKGSRHRHRGLSGHAAPTGGSGVPAGSLSGDPPVAVGRRRVPGPRRAFGPLCARCGGWRPHGPSKLLGRRRSSSCSSMPPTSHATASSRPRTSHATASQGGHQLRHCRKLCMLQLRMTQPRMLQRRMLQLRMLRLRRLSRGRPRLLQLLGLQH